MSVNAYLNFDGNAKEVVNYYAEVFETDAPYIQTFSEGMGEDPGFEIPEADKGRIMHASIHIEGSALMFSDTFSGTGEYIQGNNISLALVSKDGDYLERAYHRLAEEGIVTMALGPVDWSPAYGMLVDKFGISWLFSQEADAE